ncbi:type VII secretion-associated serine protease mycosin [Streptomyces sp. VRA16 Mangrove soil]|uniref:type VII secretion-associated serine protease mycosin n=1 Tax=Streptomyces sp. VRA16 Mangrove soil TaxID=2817434 RepID=UPI0035AC0F7A
MTAATALTAAATVTTTFLLPAPEAAAADQCEFGKTTYKGNPWSLQRVNLDELWQEATGKNVKVAVIDTGVAVNNPQLKSAVDAKDGKNLLPRKIKGEANQEWGNASGTTDTVGHGTRVAGIIAARKGKDTGFRGLAPDAKIIPIKQNDAEGTGTAATLALAIRHAIAVRADVINISQDTSNAAKPDPDLQRAVDEALAKGIVVVASAGNDGMGGKAGRTYPASYEGVLAVAASDRNNERAAFSQAGDWVGVAAPGVDMVSTVPQGGQCSDNGTSFSAPYVAAVAALLKEKHGDWSAAQIVAQIEQTAERSAPGKDDFVGWGVVDPVAALTKDDHPIESPSPEAAGPQAEAPAVPGLHFGETADERNSRMATYAAVGAVVLVVGLAGTAVAVRDARRRSGRVRGEA